jgi:hypothetical protein
MMDTNSKPPRESYLGGLRWIGGAANRPLIRLEFDDFGVHIAPSLRVLGIVVPRWNFEWSRVERAERVRTLRFGARGVRFYITGRKYSFTFEYPKPEKILDSLDRRGIPVDKSEHRKGLFET